MDDLIKKNMNWCIAVKNSHCTTMLASSLENLKYQNKNKYILGNDIKTTTMSKVKEKYTHSKYEFLIKLN